MSSEQKLDFQNVRSCGVTLGHNEAGPGNYFFLNIIDADPSSPKGKLETEQRKVETKNLYKIHLENGKVLEAWQTIVHRDQPNQVETTLETIVNDSNGARLYIVINAHGYQGTGALPTGHTGQQFAELLHKVLGSKDPDFHVHIYAGQCDACAWVTEFSYIVRNKLKLTKVTASAYADANTEKSTSIIQQMNLQLKDAKHVHLQMQALDSSLRNGPHNATVAKQMHEWDQKRTKQLFIAPPAHVTPSPDSAVTTGTAAQLSASSAQSPASTAVTAQPAATWTADDTMNVMIGGIAAITIGWVCYKIHEATKDSKP